MTEPSLKKKVLLAAYYWPPSGGSGVQRPLKFVKYLPEFGIKPYVLTPENPTYAQSDFSLADEIPDEAIVYKAKGWEPFGFYGKLAGKKPGEVANQTNAFKKEGTLLSKVAAWIRGNVFIPDARVGWSFRAKKKALFIIESQNIKNFITTGPPQSVHLMGLYIKKHRPDVQWIVDLRDPWSMVFYNDVFRKNVLSKAIDRYLEKKVLSAADKVLVVTEGNKKLMEEVLPREYQVIRNGFDHADFPKIDAAKNKVFTIRYVGLLGETYDIRGFLEALGKLAHTFEFQMEFIGNVHPYVQKLAQSLGLGNNIRFLDYLPHSEALDAMRAADALLLIIPRTKRNEAHFSGKLYEYMATGNPILNIGPKNGEPAQMIEELGCGFTADYDDADGIAETLRQWATEKKLPVKPAQASKNHPFSRFSLTEKLAGLLQ